MSMTLRKIGVGVAGVFAFVLWLLVAIGATIVDDNVRVTPSHRVHADPAVLTSEPRLTNI